MTTVTVVKSCIGQAPVQALSLARKYQTSIEVNDNGKHSSFLRSGNCYSLPLQSNICRQGLEPTIRVEFYKGIHSYGLQYCLQRLGKSRSGKHSSLLRCGDSYSLLPQPNICRQSQELTIRVEIYKGIHSDGLQHCLQILDWCRSG